MSVKAVQHVPSEIWYLSGIIFLARFNPYINVFINTANFLTMGSAKIFLPLPPGCEALLSLTQGLFQTMDYKTSCFL